MEFIVRECPNNGILGGPFEKTITAYIGQQHSLAEISIEQFGERIITVHTVEDASIYDLHHLYFDLKRLIMLMDGQFYPITSVTQDGVEITTSIQKKLLPNYFSADFMIGENNRLINFDEVLSETLFSKSRATSQSTAAAVISFILLSDSRGIRYCSQYGFILPFQS